MVFKVDNYRSDIESILKRNNPQAEFDEWIKKSPVSGKELAFTTWFSRKSTLKKYLSDNYNFDYVIPAEELDEYKKLKTDQFQQKEMPQINITRLSEFIENFNTTLEDDDLKDYVLADKKDRKKISANNKVSNVCIFLMITCGRRINEFHNKFEGEGGGFLIFRLSKNDGLKTARVKPLVDVCRWVELYTQVKPFLELYSIETLTTRLNRFVKTIEPGFTTHSLRKIYADVCASLDKRRISKIKKIKECLHHENIASSAHYEVKNVKTKGCDVCGIDVLTKNYSRHLKSKKHQKRTE